MSYKHTYLSVLFSMLLCSAFAQSATALLEDLQQFQSIHAIHTDTLPTSTPEMLAQQQLDAYNAGDIDAFLIPYSEDVEIYNFPGAGEPQTKGKENMRSSYEAMFRQFPELHCKLVNRMIMGNTVIDQESITGIPGGKGFEAIAIYKIENGKIAKVYFIQ